VCAGNIQFQPDKRSVLHVRLNPVQGMYKLNKQTSQPSKGLNRKLQMVGFLCDLSMLVYSISIDDFSIARAVSY